MHSTLSLHCQASPDCAKIDANDGSWMSVALSAGSTFDSVSAAFAKVNDPANPKTFWMCNDIKNEGDCGPYADGKLPVIASNAAFMHCAGVAASR